MRYGTTIKWLGAFGVAILLYCIAPDNVSDKLPLYLALSAFAVVLWATEVVPPIATAAALTFSYVLFLGMDPSLVFAPWGESLIWIGFGGMIFGESMKSTGLAKRLSLRCIMLAKGSFNSLLVGFALAGIVLAILLPSFFARVVIFCTIGIGIIESLDIRPKSRLSSSIIMMAFFAATAPGYLFLHTSESFIWAFEMMFGKGPKLVDFWDYALHGTFLSLLYVAASFATVQFVKGKENFPPAEKLSAAVKSAYLAMPTMSGREWRLLGLVAIGISAFMLEPWTGLNAVFVFCLVSLLCYLPQLDIEKPESFNRLNMIFILMITACIAMGMVGSAVGSNAWMVSKVKPLLEGMSPTMGVFSSYLAGVAVNFVLTPLAATAAFAPAFGELGVQMNMNPLPLFYAFNYGLDQYVLPYEMVLFLYIFTTGFVQLRHVVKALAIRAVLCGVIIVAIAVPYWKWIGIL